MSINATPLPIRTPADGERSDLLQQLAGFFAA